MKKKIFIVEDEEMLSKVLAEQFSKAGFDVKVASDGKEALKSVGEFEPDIILLDIILPKINGFDVLKSIKENPGTSSVPVIMISNLGRDEDIKQAIKLGAVDYFIKAQHPIFEIIEKVSKFLELPRSPLEKFKAPIKERKIVEKIVKEKPAEIITNEPIQEPIENPEVLAKEKKTIEKIIEEKKPVEIIAEKSVGKVEKGIIETPSEEIGKVLGKIIDIAKESAKQVPKKPAEKIVEKERPQTKKIEKRAVVSEKPIEKIGKIKKKEDKKFPHLSKGARKFIRMKKAELNKINITPEEREKEIAKIYQTFSIGKKDASSTK